MATSGPGPVRELDYGAVEVYSEKSLGVGSYGKVCKAKCGHLPCAAKLLHDTMFGNDDPGIDKYVEQFEQECRFLRMIKHPNIVQFLGTVTDPQSRRLALLMELMDESLTRFLERSTGPLPYHIQLNICHDVALALAYLHPNDIIHRDLSSNNVLLISEGSRAKVTDFGMSKLEGMNPRMTPLTLCPGTAAYMPPEALITPPRYSNKLDCFSHGVLTIQIVTRQFPNPTDATTTVEDDRSPTGEIQLPVPERERRKKDIDLVDPNHPLLPLALHCVNDRAMQRPSADELCGRLATLKGEHMYTRSVEQSREQSVSVQTLQQQIREKDGELAAARANHEIELQECSSKIEQKSDELEKARANHEIELQEYSHKIEQKSDELERARANHETELQEYSRKIQQKSDELEKARANHEIELQEYSHKIEQKSDELERARANHETELRECHATFQQQIQEKESMLEKVRADSQIALQATEVKPKVYIPPSLIDQSDDSEEDVIEEDDDDFNEGHEDDREDEEGDEYDPFNEGHEDDREDEEGDEYDPYDEGHEDDRDEEGDEYDPLHDYYEGHEDDRDEEGDEYDHDPLQHYEDYEHEVDALHDHDDPYGEDSDDDPYKYI